jgi:hypothetical protein
VALLRSEQGDQIGLIFAYKATVYFCSFVKITEIAHIIGLFFPMVKVMYLFSEEMDRATFCASGHPGPEPKQHLGCA